MSQPNGLASKLSEVMAAVGYVPKNGTNARQGYKFAAASDVADAVRGELAARHVSLVPETVEHLLHDTRPTSSGGTMFVDTLRVTWRATDGDSGETATWQSVGTGEDSSDKAVYKAMTGALKYGLLLAFQIPTGDDPEADQPQHQGAALPHTTDRAVAATRASSLPSGPTDGGAVPSSRAPVPDEPPWPGEEIERGGYRAGDRHDPAHNPLKARNNGSLYCPTKMGAGWCDWTQAA